MRRIVGVLLVTLAAWATAQTLPSSDWLSSPAAASFRQRVIDLAVLYDESSGIDPHDFKVVTRKLSALPDGCFRVEAITLQDERPVRRDELIACGKAAAQ